MAFSDVQQKVVAKAAVEALHTEIAPLAVFAKSYNSELDGMYGQAVAIPTISLSAGEFDADSNNLEGTNEFDGVVLTLDKDFVGSVRISDKNLAYSGIDFAKNAGTAIGNALARAANKYTMGLINSTNVTLTAEISGAADLVAVAAENDIPVNDSVVLLDPVEFSAVLKELGAYNIYGDQEAIRNGVLKNTYGFANIVRTSYLPEGTKGAIVPMNALATASLYCAPVFPESFAGVWKATDEDNGLAISMTEHSNTATGYGYVTGRVLFGAKLIQPSKIIRLV